MTRRTSTLLGAGAAIALLASVLAWSGAIGPAAAVDPPAPPSPGAAAVDDVVALPEPLSPTATRATTVDVLTNDSYGLLPLTSAFVSGLSVTVTTPVGSGSAVSEADGTITYTPDDGFGGVDSFRYSWTATIEGVGEVTSPEASVTVGVGLEAPLPNQDDVEVTQDTPTNLDPAANDTDPQGHDLAVTGTSDPANGSTVVEVDGTVTYTPDAGFFGPDSFTYTVEDIFGAAATGLVDVDVVRPEPLAPIARDDAGSTVGQTIFIDVAANDTDPDDGPPEELDYSIVSGPSDGSLDCSDPCFSEIGYTPTAVAPTTDSFVYQVCDDTSPTPLCDTATVTIDVDPMDLPAAVDDTATGEMFRTVDIDVVDNDAFDGFFGFGGDVFIELESDSFSDTTDEGGEIFCFSTCQSSSGVIEYNPPDTYAGPFPLIDTFDYDLCDSDPILECVTATVTVTVTASMNVAPTAVDDEITVTEVNAGGGESVIIFPFGNDTDPDPEDTFLEFASPAPGFNTPTDGELDCFTSICFYELPDPVGGFTSTSFTYQATDGIDTSNTATVTITLGDDQPPVAVDDDEFVYNGQTTDLFITDNDTDPDGPSPFNDGTITVASLPATGTLLCNLVGEGGTGPAAVDDECDELLFDPDPGTYVTSFTYRVNTAGETSNVATVTVNVFEGPETSDNTRYVSEFEVDPDGARVFAFVDDEGRSDVPDGPPAVTNGPTNGDLTFDDYDLAECCDGFVFGYSVDWIYVPDVDHIGTDSFDWEVCEFFVDSVEESEVGAEATVCTGATMTVVTVGARDDITSTPQTTPVDIDVLVNDEGLPEEDGEGSTMPNIRVRSGPIFGTVEVDDSDDVNPIFTYTPSPGFYGTDSFVYDVCWIFFGEEASDDEITVAEFDDSDWCGRATVTIDVPGPGPAGPIATDDFATTPFATPLVVAAPGVLDNDASNDEVATAAELTDPANGEVVVSGDGSFTYTPDEGFSGVDSFTYTITDTYGSDTATVVVVVEAGNVAPTAGPGEIASREDPIEFWITPLVTDPDSPIAPGTLNIVTNGSFGTATPNGDGSVLYTPDLSAISSVEVSIGAAFTDTVTYEVTDIFGATSNRADLTITITTVDPTPTPTPPPNETPTPTPTPSPTPDPTPSPSPEPMPTTEATVDPTPAPTPPAEPTVTPQATPPPAGPTPAPTPDATPEPTPDPTTEPTAEPPTDPPATPEPSPEPTPDDDGEVAIGGDPEPAAAVLGATLGRPLSLALPDCAGELTILVDGEEVPTTIDGDAVEIDTVGISGGLHTVEILCDDESVLIQPILIAQVSGAPGGGRTVVVTVVVAGMLALLFRLVPTNPVARRPGGER